MNKNQKIIIAAVAFLLFMNLIFMPYMVRRQVTKRVTTILDSWQNDDYATPMTYWLRPEESPPMYGLESYSIERVTFGKKDRKPYAKYWITLDLSDENLLPSGETWLCEMLKTKNGWKVINFKMAFE